MSDVKNRPVTALDESLVQAQKDPGAGNLFYDAFLNADLFLPVKAAHGEAAWRQLGMEAQFHPLFLNFEGGKAVPVFDQLSRMKAWSEGEPMDFILLKGHLLVKLMGKSVFIVVNVGTGFDYTLTPDILESLREAMQPVKRH